MELCSFFIAFVGSGREGVKRTVSRSSPTGNVFPHGNPRVRLQLGERGVQRFVDCAVQVSVEITCLIGRAGGVQCPLPALVVLTVGDDKVLDAAIQCA